MPWGKFTVDKSGTLTGPDNAPESEQLLVELAMRGYEGEQERVLLRSRR